MQPLGLLGALVQHAVADEAVADPDHDRHLAHLAPDRDRGRERVEGGLLAAHDLEQLHDVRRAEEMRPEHVLRALRHGGDLVHVERRGVGGEDRAGLCDPVEVGEDALLEVHLLEHRLDDEVGVAASASKSVEPVMRRDAAVALLLGQPAARDRAGVVLPDRRKAAVERVLRGLDDRHRDAGIGEVHGDAAAHGAGADDAALADLARLHAGRHVRHLLGLALGEEDVALGARFLARQELHEQLELARLALAERLVEAVAHRFDAGRDRAQAAGALRRGISRAGEARRVGACRRRADPRGRARG